MCNFNKYFLIRMMLLCSLFFINFQASAEDIIKPTIADPVQFLHHITDQVLTNIKEKKQYNEISIEGIINQIIMPNVDFDEMGQWIAGRAVWNKSSTSDKREFTKQLRYMLIKTYASTLNNYSQEKVEFQHYSGDLSAKRIQIKSKVVRANKDNLSVDYRLIAKDNSWKVYDLIIEGVSILQGFRVQFSDDIRQHGLALVTDKIKEHNSR